MIADKIPSKREIVGVIEAQTETLQELSERLVKIEELTRAQESRNHNITQVVIIGFVIIVVTVAVEVILTNRFDGSMAEKFYNTLESHRNNSEEKINKLEDGVFTIRKDLELLRAKNSYLK